MFRWEFFGLCHYLQRQNLHQMNNWVAFSQAEWTTRWVIIVHKQKIFFKNKFTSNYDFQNLVPNQGQGGSYLEVWSIKLLLKLVNGNSAETATSNSSNH